MSCFSLRRTLVHTFLACGLSLGVQASSFAQSVNAAADGASATASDTQQRGAWFQATYIWQTKPGFNAAYSGPNSLIPQAEISTTLSMTAYLGWRPWAGGEIYFNPEGAQGRVFSNVTGLGGFPNGEVTRTSGPDLTFYRQRLFLRQTWNQGGGDEVLPSGINQLAGTVDKNRWVLTAGNFSTLDVFDNNAYAKDPRRQFMNWGNMSYAAYDYAADARGFSWGFAAEKYWDNWALRFGRMTGPETPNGLTMDFNILNHYGDQVELERGHEWAGRPGKVRVLAFRNRAVLARYRDAINQATPGNAPDMVKARAGEQFKTGLGLNLEQELSPGVGVYARMMQTDGATETYAFTEADQSLSVGVSVRGERWGRANDVWALSFMQNGLSNDRRDYLRAGGTSFFIGDGGLNYAPETILETYYSVSLRKDTTLSLNLQHISNPAYNADRGPVVIGGVRLHTEF